MPPQSKHLIWTLGEPRTVRMIYFLPNNRPFRQEIVDSMKVAIRQIQTFYADQMEAHGHGRKTFRFETDAQGEPLIHRVDGQHPDSYYTFDAVWDELGQTFDVNQNIFFVGVSYNTMGLGGRFTKNSGMALFPNRPSGGLEVSRFKWEVEAHELGHAFGWGHDFRDGAYLMSYGPGQDRLSACHAEFLSMHPYFNSDTPIEETSPPTIELISPPAYPRGSTSVSIQLKVSDSEGLHQVILHDRVYDTVRTCRGLNGETETIVEFDYDINANGTRLWAEVIDTHGNVSFTSFELICENCPQMLVKVSGDNQQGLTNAQLNDPFVVESRDQNGNALVGVPVTFTVTAGGGKLNGRFTVENAITDANGRAQSTLTLGPNPGINTVAVSIAGPEPVTFNAVGVGTTTTPITGGEYQKWHLPDGAIARLGKGKIGQSDRSVAFSPDGQRLAVASHIGVWLYDVATSRELALFKTMGQAQSVAFSTDGTMLAANTGSVQLWNVSTQEPIRPLTDGTGFGHISYVVAFSPDGATFASHRWDTIFLWDVATGENIATLEGHTDDVNTLAFSPDGTMLASASGDNTVKLWNAATGENIATLEGHTREVNSVAFSPNGATLASASDDGSIKLWNVATGKNTATHLHGLDVNSVAFSPDGITLASGAASWESERRTGTVKLWNIATGKNTATLRHIAEVRSVIFSPNGATLASASDDGRINLWNVATQNSVGFEGHTDGVSSVVFSPDGTTLASGVWGGKVNLWNVATKRNIATLEGHEWAGVKSVAFSPDGMTLATGTFEKVDLWDIATQKKSITFGGLPDVFSVAFSPDRTTLAAGTQANKVELWDVATGESIATLRGHTTEGDVRSVAFSPNGALLASGSTDGMIYLWDMATKRNIATLVHTTIGWVNAVAFSPDGATLASGNGTWERVIVVKLWDVATRRNIAMFGEHGWDDVTSVAFSPDGTTLAVGLENGWVQLWDIVTRRKRNIVTLEGQTFGASVSFSPKGTMLVSGAGDGTILLWDMSKYVTPVDNISNGNLRATTLLKISGDKQKGAPSDLLANPLVVEVKDQNGNALEGVAVTFTVTAGGGTISTTTDTTDANGHAQTTLTLGSDAGTNTVSVTVAGIEQPVAFTGEAVAATSDFNGDDAVDFSDFLLFTAQFGFSQEDEGYQARFDLDGDGTIGFGDFLIFANSFGTSGS